MSLTGDAKKALLKKLEGKLDKETAELETRFASVLESSLSSKDAAKKQAHELIFPVAENLRQAFQKFVREL